MEKIAIFLGNNMFIGDVLKVLIDGKIVDFFRVREIFRVLSSGSYLTIDCDIKDKDNKREIKLFKSKPVAKPETVKVVYDHKLTHVTREDGTTIIKIEQIESNDPTLPKEGIVSDKLKSEKFDSILRITGDFYAGPFKVFIDNNSLITNGVNIWNNVKESKGGLLLTPGGFSF
jgi:hypothetical protein